MPSNPMPTNPSGLTDADRLAILNPILRAEGFVQVDTADGARSLWANKVLDAAYAKGRADAEDEVTQHYDRVVREREHAAASKAWDAAMHWELTRHGSPSRDEWREEGDRYLAATYSPPAPTRVTLSDGRTVEWTQWDTRRGVSNERTLDLVTNIDRPGSESRSCFASLDEMRQKAALNWHDWQAVEAFAATHGGTP